MTPAEAMTRLKDWWGEARASKLFWYGLLGALAVFLLDQATKYWVLHIIDLPNQVRPCAKNPAEMCRQIALSPLFDLSYVENRGASFGMLHGRRWLLTLIVCSVSAGLIAWLGRVKRPLVIIAIAFILGGAIGNLYDRLAYGYVVDFLDFSSVPFPNFERIAAFPYIRVFIGGFVWVFNIADAAINVGIAFLLYDAWRTGQMEKTAEKAAKKTPEKQA